MAKKRSLIDGVLTAVGASDCFSQDLEDLPEEYINQRNTSPKQTQPAVEQKQKPVEQPNPNLGIIKERISSLAKSMGISNADLKRICKEMTGKTSDKLTELELLEFEKKLESRRMENDDIPDVEMPNEPKTEPTQGAVEYFPDAKINSDKRFQILELFHSAGCVIEKEIIERINFLGYKISDLSELTFAQADKVIEMLNGYLKK